MLLTFILFTLEVTKLVGLCVTMKNKIYCIYKITSCTWCS